MSNGVVDRARWGDGDRNETLFLRLLHDHIDEMMPVVSTPVVGEACQQFSHVFRRSRGLYISYEQRHQIDTILRNHARPPAVIVVTDGERILGLGDQGIGGMSIPTGKLSPGHCVPLGSGAA